MADKPSPARVSRRSRSRRHGLAASALAVTLAFGAAACSSGSSTNGSTGTSKSTDAAANGSTFDPARYADVSATLNGSGSTFQANFDNLAISTLGGVLPTLTINYGGGGSGKGKTDLRNSVVDFAGTDSLVKEADLAAYGGRLLYFPTVVAPITVPYNLPGVADLKLDGPVLAGIFTRGITSWDDPAIAALNPEASLPSTPITVCHRADSSGTTTNFTKYLTKAGGDAWTLGSSDSIDWDPATQGGSGNAGVAQCVKGKAGAIGYVDLSDARSQKLVTAAIRNRNGEFVQPTVEGASKAAEGAEIADDLTYSPIDAEGAGAYPITSPTWILVRAEQPDAAKRKALDAFLRFVLTDGQSLAESAGYAPLPESLATRAIAQLDEITAG